MKLALVTLILLSLLCDAQGQVLCPGPNCTQDPCTGIRSSRLGYTANWTVRGDVVYFQVSANTPGWVGIGFSHNRFMPQSDVVVGAADGSGNSFIVDGYALSYSMPQEDAKSNLQEASVSRSGEILTMQFARKRVTNDTSRDISLDQCVFLLHAWGRGVRNYAAKQYFYHSYRNFVVLRKVCFPNSTLCPPECDYNGQTYNPGDTFNSTDGCNTCTCSGDGRVSCTETACLPTCTHSLCQSESKATCSIPCNGGSKVTSCRACYYDDEERSVPKKCRYRCGENPKKKCLRKWAKCVAKKYKKKFGTTPNQQRTAALFKCAVPMACENK